MGNNEAGSHVKAGYIYTIRVQMNEQKQFHLRRVGMGKVSQQNPGVFHNENSKNDSDDFAMVILHRIILCKPYCSSELQILQRIT